MSDNVLELTDETYKTEIESASVPLVIDIWAPWCGPCRMVGPIVEQVDENQNAAAEFGVQAIPTILFFSGGEEVDRIVGAQGKEALKAKIESLLNG